MNYTVVVIGVVLVILLYIIYGYIYSSKTTLAKQSSLKGKNPAIDIKNNPSSTRYSYSMWVYINTWNNTDDKVFFQRTLDDKRNDVKLYVDKTKPVLYFSVNNNSPIQITDNFPVQKWTFVLISVDNQFVDSYLDGKLVRSTKLKKMPNHPSKKTQVKLGTGFDALITKFTHSDSPSNPQDVWSEYMSGNGGSMTKMKSGYNVNVTVLKNNVEKNKFSLV